MESVLSERSSGVAVGTATATATVTVVSCTQVQVEDSDVSSVDDQDEYLARPVRKKRPNRRYAEWSSDDEYCLRAVKRSFPKYKEVDSSSESESDFTRPPARDTTLRPSGLPVGVVRGCPRCSDCQEVLARWRPEGGCKPSVGEAPVFYPTEEEFKDTLKYIAKIRPEAEPFGICRVVTPPGWRPPCPLRDDLAKRHVLKFPTRIQEIHKLQNRRPVRKCSQPPSRQQRLGGGGRRGRGGGCRGGRMGGRASGRRTSTGNLSATAVAAAAATAAALAAGGHTKANTDASQPDESFGFEPGSYFSLGAFEKYAEQFKEQYFVRSAKTNAEVASGAGAGAGSAAAAAVAAVAGSGAVALNNQSDGEGDSALRVDPSVDAIEAEYWRIVERPTEQIEVLYGADVETGSFGSGFPKAKTGDTVADPNSYEKSGWNLNNIARLPGSMLAFEEGDISGVLVPWLYIGMCFSSFCWHVEDHHFYSLNYLHWGAPKVWYGVAGDAAHRMEAVMKKHLPELFEEQPDLLHKLVTQLSPAVLKGEGLPVYRLVQQAGEFVITFPRAYHSGFNCGFNCAEAVNLAPVDWLPHGQSAVELYQRQRRKTSVSHDKLLLAAAREAVNGWLRWQKSRQGTSGKPPWGSVVEQEVLREEDPKEIHSHTNDTETGYAWQSLCGRGGILVNALKARVELERSRRSSLGAVNMRMKPMDFFYDATDERECAECHYDLHLSAVGCDCSPDKYVCLAHSHLLCRCPPILKTFLYRHSLAQLDLLIAALEERPEALRAWSETGAVAAACCSSSSSSVSAAALTASSSFHHHHPLDHRTVGAGAGAGAGVGLGNLGRCEFNSTEFPNCRPESSGRHVESSPRLSSHGQVGGGGHTSTTRSTTLANGKPEPHQSWAGFMFPSPVAGGRGQHTLKSEEEVSLDEPLLRPGTVLRRVSSDKLETHPTREQQRVQLSDMKRVPVPVPVPNGVVKVETKILETSSVRTTTTTTMTTRKREVIVLSDDEDGVMQQQTIARNKVESPSTTSTTTVNARPEGSKRIYSPSNLGSFSDAEARGSSAVGQSGPFPVPAPYPIPASCAGPANIAAAPTISAGRQSSLAGDSGGSPQTQTQAVSLPDTESSIPISILAQTLHPPSCMALTPSPPQAHQQPTPTRPLRSIGSLKQQARAGCAQQRLIMSARAAAVDHHLQRLRSGTQEGLSKAELCGQALAPDINVPPSPSPYSAQAQVQEQAGNGNGSVHSRTPVRAERPSGPRVAKVLRKKLCCEVELLNVGSLVHQPGWHNMHSIFPAGFKSRTSFCNVLNILDTCHYISEIVHVEGGQGGPRFMVSMEGNAAIAFSGQSPDLCWQAAQDKVNQEIIRRRYCGETSLPSLQPPQSLNGLDMFGLTTPTIVQAVEALDPQQRCCEYWSAKSRNVVQSGCYAPAAAPEQSLLFRVSEVYQIPPVSNGNGGASAGAATVSEQSLRGGPDDLYIPVSNCNEAAAAPAAHVEVISRPTTPTTETVSRRAPSLPLPLPPVERERGRSRGGNNDNNDLYDVLKAFLQKGTAEELWAFHRVLGSDYQGKERRDGFQALTDVLTSRTSSSPSPSSI